MKGKKTGGRQKGTPNKASAEIREAARQYTAAALRELARLAREAESEAARVAAIKELLDRGHGKATQPLEHGNAGAEPFVVRVITGVPRRHDDQ